MDPSYGCGVSRRPLPVVEDRAILAKICSQGCVRRPGLDTAKAYAFSIRNDISQKEHLLFVPHGAVRGSYTVAQVDELEQVLAYYSLELLPL